MRGQLVGALETKLAKMSEDGKSFGSDYGSITVLRLCTVYCGYWKPKSAVMRALVVKNIT